MDRSLLMDSMSILLCSVVILVWLGRFQTRKNKLPAFLTPSSHQTHRRRRWNDSRKQLRWRRPQPAQRANISSLLFPSGMALIVLFSPKGSADQEQKVHKISFIISSRFLPSSNGQDHLSLPPSTATTQPLIHQPTSPQASSVSPVHTLEPNEKPQDIVFFWARWLVYSLYSCTFRLLFSIWILFYALILINPSRICWEPWL
jgi:hypothetical protein